MATKKSGRRCKAMHLILELVLILAAVLIFRSSWLLLDKISWLSTPLALVLTLIFGIVVTLRIFDLLFQHKEEH